MLLNLLSPILKSYLVPKPSPKLNILVGSLSVIGAFWVSLATYLYYIADMDKAWSAMVTGAIFLLSSLIIYTISCIIRKKVENKIIGTAMNEVMPIVNTAYDIINAPRFKIALPIVALVAGYMLFKKKD